MALAVAETLDSVKQDVERDEEAKPIVDGVGTRTSVDHLLRKYENAIMLAHLEDSASDGLENCCPILLNAIKDCGSVFFYSFNCKSSPNTWLPGNLNFMAYLFSGFLY